MDAGGSVITSVPHEAGEVGRAVDEVGVGRAAGARQGGGGLSGVGVGVDAAEATVVGIPRVADDGAEGDRGLCQPGDVARYGEVLSGAQGHVIDGGGAAAAGQGEVLLRAAVGQHVEGADFVAGLHATRADGEGVGRGSGGTCTGVGADAVGRIGGGHLEGDVGTGGQGGGGLQGHFGYHELQVGSDAGVGAIPRGSGGVGDAHGAAGGDAGEVAGGVAAVIGPEEEGVRAVPIQVGRIRIGVVTACGHRRGSDFDGTPVHDLNQAAGDGIVLSLADGAGLHLVRSGHGDGDGACAVGVEGCGLVVAATCRQEQQREGAEQGEIPSQPTSVKLC